MQEMPRQGNRRYKGVSMKEIALELKGMIRPFVTIMLSMVFCYLALIGKINPDVFTSVVITVTTYWFADRKSRNLAEEKTNGKEEPKIEEVAK